MFRVGLVTFLCMLAILAGFGGHGASPTPAPQATPTSQSVKAIFTDVGRTWRDFCGSRNSCKIAAAQQS
jgi:hypothetical protein